MAFGGYYLKVSNVTFPVKYMVIPSYSIDDAPIIVSDYRDAAYNRHIIRAPKEDVTIKFKLRQLNHTELPTALGFFSDNMALQYYDPKDGTYKSGTFTCTSNLTPQISKQVGNNALWYEEIEITLVRKAG